MIQPELPETLVDESTVHPQLPQTMANDSADSTEVHQEQPPQTMASNLLCPASSVSQAQKRAACRYSLSQFHQPTSSKRKRVPVEKY